MAKGNFLLLGGLAILGAIALNKQSGTNRSANIGSSLKDTLDLTDAASLAKIISGSPDLQAYLKKIAGSNVTPTTVPTVQDIVTNINNSYTLDGVQYKTFADSLLTNGAGELGNNSNNVNCSYSIEEGKAVFTQTSGDYIQNQTNIPFVSDRLYKHSFYSRGLGNIYAFVVNQDIGGNILNKALNNWSGAYSVFGIPSSVGFVKRTGYIGGIDENGVSTFHPNTHSFRTVSVYHSGGGSIHSQIFEIVPLGEPVPSNLPWFPTGQEVYDSTTGDRGRYNGTTIDWYTMV